MKHGSRSNNELRNRKHTTPGERKEKQDLRNVVNWLLVCQKKCPTEDRFTSSFHEPGIFLYMEKDVIKLKILKERVYLALPEYALNTYIFKREAEEEQRYT